ncbi:hypothetical protein MKEN_00019200 [Mycena kentingensis (nom. inval.)]|nr:hypothetical protein MKEN_00019200 [Mycena kentingensis (nom. inval.)]
MPLLTLPPELLHESISSLPIDDIARLLKVGNRALTRIISTSPMIQYRIAQDAAGVVETTTFARAGTCMVERHRTLKEREERWLALNPVNRVSVALGCDWEQVNGRIVMEHDFGVLRRLNPTNPASTCTILPFSSVGVPTWRQLHSDPTQIFFHVCAELDLFISLACVAIPAQPNRKRLQFSCRTLGSGGTLPHPQCLYPGTIGIIAIPATYDGFPLTVIDVADATIVFSLMFSNSREYKDYNKLHIFDWTTGNRRAPPRPISNAAFTFLDPDHIVVVVIAPRLGLAVVSLRAAEPKKVHRDASSASRTNEVHEGSDRRHRGQFLASGAASMFAVKYDIASVLRNGDGQVASTVVFVIQRAGLRQLFEQRRNRNSRSRVRAVRLSDWAPYISRAFTPWDAFQDYAESICGHRFVTLEQASADASDLPVLRVRDFNPSTVRAIRRRIQDTGGEELDLGTAIARVVEADAAYARGLEQFQSPLVTQRVVSALPFVEITSKERFDYSAVYITNDHIIGEKGGEEQDGEAGLEILYFSTGV